MRTLVLVLILGLAAPACAADPQAAPRLIRPTPPPRTSAPSTAVEMRLLEAHNAERRRAGVAPLAWEEGLEAEARAWARRLIQTGRFEHDPAQHGHGENLWTGWGDRTWTPGEMVAEWAAEKSDYRHGVFPDVSRTGDWRAVGHYTQMIWSGTTHVGCAIATQGDRSVLACRYSPPGNIDGMSAY